LFFSSKTIAGMPHQTGADKSIGRSPAEWRGDGCSLVGDGDRKVGAPQTGMIVDAPRRGDSPRLAIAGAE
jgi:hypothetical protein